MFASNLKDVNEFLIWDGGATATLWHHHLNIARTARVVMINTAEGGMAMVLRMYA
jgi:hypothetical protein